MIVAGPPRSRPRQDARALSMLLPELDDVDQVLAAGVEAERAGLHGLWVGSGLGFDSLTVCALLSNVTSTLQLGTAVSPIWARHPLALAQQSLTVSAVSGGRLRVGIGVSHPATVRALYGRDFNRVADRAQEYLEVMSAALAGARFDIAGEFYSSRGRIHAPDTTPRPPVLLAAMRRRMCVVAGRAADGVLPVMAPPAQIADDVVPWAAAAAAEAGRPKPKFVVGVPCVVGSSMDEARRTAKDDHRLLILGRRPIYRDLVSPLTRRDAAPTDDGWLDTMLEHVVALGQPHDIVALLEDYVAAGADEIMMIPFGPREVFFSALDEISAAWARI